MGCNHRCVITLNTDDPLFIIGFNGEYTDDLNRARIFPSEYDAYLYVDKHGYGKLAKVRIIHEKGHSR